MITFDEVGRGEDNCRASNTGDDEPDGGVGEDGDRGSRCGHWLLRPEEVRERGYERRSGWQFLSSIDGCSG